jgi:D-alanyl-D-alanine carboxypeptidase
MDATWAWAAGSVVSNAADISRFFEALLGGRFLDDGLLKQMTTLVPPLRRLPRKTATPSY